MKNTLMDFPSAKETVCGGKMTGNFHSVACIFFCWRCSARFDHNEYEFELNERNFRISGHYFIIMEYV